MQQNRETLGSGLPNQVDCMEKRIPWRRLLAEGVAIVASILLAFSIDALWKERETRGLQERALEEIATHFEANDVQLARWAATNRRIVHNSGLLLDLLEESDAGMPVLVPDTLLVAAILIPTYDPLRASVDAFLSSGGLSSLGNEQLQASLAFWLRELDDMAEDEETVTGIESAQIVPTLARQLSLSRLYDELLTWSLQGRSDVLSTSTSEVVADPELAGLIAHRRWRVRVILNQMEGLVQLQQQIASEIKDELGR